MTIQHLIPKRPGLYLGAVLALSIAAPLSAKEAAVGMYECTKGGVTSFSDVPCGPDEQHVEVDYQQPSNPEGAAAAAHGAETQADQIGESEVLDTEILNVQQQISRLEVERDAKIAALRRERFAGSEALDEQTWRAGLDAQIEAVAQDYQTRLETHGARLADLQAQRATLPPPRP